MLELFIYPCIIINSFFVTAFLRVSFLLPCSITYLRKFLNFLQGRNFFLSKTRFTRDLNLFQAAIYKYRSALSWAEIFDGFVIYGSYKKRKKKNWLFFLWVHLIMFGDKLCFCFQQKTCNIVDEILRGIRLNFFSE